MTPLQRYYKLLLIEKRDIYQIFFYSIFAGLVSLSLPLGIQAIINFIQSGRVTVSWIVLIIVVVLGVALAGILALMQLRITENLQQKIFVRSSFEFAARIPRIKFEEINDTYPPELANRFFDTMTIQKGTSKLLIDFSAALLQILFGIILLSFYHPYFIMLGFLLIILLYLIFKYSYFIGLENSLKVSKYKYKVAGWLQEMARNNYSFRKEINYDYALQKNDNFAREYLNYRESLFGVLKRQFSHLILFKVFITISLLSIGGFLVISQEMNIGQFVAAEIIILLVINSVEKIILGLETLYDVLTAVEKIGLVTDLAMEEDTVYEANKSYQAISLTTEGVGVTFPGSVRNIINNINVKINQGERVFIEGQNGSGKTTLIRVLSGLLQPTQGALYINDDTFKKINLKQYRSQIGNIIHTESPFEGTILENIIFNNPNCSDEDIKWALDGVQLSQYIKSLPQGLDTPIFPEGQQLSSSNAQKILLARSIVNKPKVLFYEDPADDMDEKVANEIIDFITSEQNQWTIIVSSKNQYWKTKCNRYLTMEKGQIISDIKK